MTRPSHDGTLSPQRCEICGREGHPFTFKGKVIVRCADTEACRRRAKAKA